MYKNMPAIISPWTSLAEQKRIADLAAQQAAIKKQQAQAILTQSSTNATTPQKQAQAIAAGSALGTNLAKPTAAGVMAEKYVAPVVKPATPAGVQSPVSSATQGSSLTGTMSGYKTPSGSNIYVSPPTPERKLGDETGGLANFKAGLQQVDDYFRRQQDTPEQVIAKLGSQLGQIINPSVMNAGLGSYGALQQRGAESIYQTALDKISEMEKYQNEYSASILDSLPKSFKATMSGSDWDEIKSRNISPELKQRIAEAQALEGGTKDGFTLSEGQQRYDASGNLIASFGAPSTTGIADIQASNLVGTTGGECGTFAHSLVNFAPVGDLFTEKQQAVNKNGILKTDWLQQGAQVGDVIISDSNLPYGHVAVVNSVNPDGTVTLTESNFNLDKKVTNNRKISMNDANIYGVIRGTPVQQVSDAQKIAKDIFEGNSNLRVTDLPTSKKQAVEAELSRLRQEAKASGDTIGLLRASAGGKEVGDSFMTSFDKAANVVYQIGELQNIFQDDKAFSKYSKEKKKENGFDMNPIWGQVRKMNPWDMNAQQIKASLQAIVPNLARGIYGEVGVLTDNDIKNYSQTLPTLTSTEEVRQAVLGMTIRSVQRAIENKLLTQVAGGRDVSGYVNQYLEVKGVADRLLGIEDTIKDTNGTTQERPPIGSYVNRLSGYIK